MKIIIFITALLFATNTAKSQIIQAELIANGLTCSMCSNATLKQLNTLSFVDSIQVDLEHTSFILFFKKGMGVNINQIKNKVEAAGFSVGSLILKVNFTNQQINDGLSFDLEKQYFIGMNTEQKLLKGDAKIKILNKGFVADKEYKTILKSAVNYPNYEKGVNAEGKILFHIKIV